VCVMTCPSANLTLDEMDKLPEGTDMKDQAATKPNLKVALDKDLDASAFGDIDGAAGLVDAGAETA